MVRPRSHIKTYAWERDNVTPRVENGCEVVVFGILLSMADTEGQWLLHRCGCPRRRMFLRQSELWDEDEPDFRSGRGRVPGY